MKFVSVLQLDILHGIYNSLNACIRDYYDVVITLHSGTPLMDTSLIGKSQLDIKQLRSPRSPWWFGFF